MESERACQAPVGDATHKGMSAGMGVGVQGKKEVSPADTGAERMGEEFGVTGKGTCILLPERGLKLGTEEAGRSTM